MEPWPLKPAEWAQEANNIQISMACAFDEHERVPAEPLKHAEGLMYLRSDPARSPGYRTEGHRRHLHPASLE